MTAQTGNKDRRSGQRGELCSTAATPLQWNIPSLMKGLFLYNILQIEMQRERSHFLKRIKPNKSY